MVHVQKLNSSIVKRDNYSKFYKMWQQHKVIHTIVRVIKDIHYMQCNNINLEVDCPTLSFGLATKAKDNGYGLRGSCEDFLHTSTTKICTHKKPG
jgi:hypothetical protein